MQPIIDENLYKMGDEALRQERGVHDCQESLDALAGLTSDQYDSFWEGYWDAHREVRGPTTGDYWFPTLPSQIKEREESLQRLKERGRTPKA